MSSQAYLLRSQIAARIADQVDGLTTDDILIDRQQDIYQAIDENVRIATNGIVCTVLPAAGETKDPRSQALVMQATIAIDLWSLPILMTGAVPEEDIHQDLMVALHHWKAAIHTDDSRTAWQRCMVLGFRDIADPNYLRRQTTIRCEFAGIS